MAKKNKKTESVHWGDIEREFVTSEADITIAALGRAYNIPKPTINRHALDERWREKRKEWLRQGKPPYETVLEQRETGEVRQFKLTPGKEIEKKMLDFANDQVDLLGKAIEIVRSKYKNHNLTTVELKNLVITQNAIFDIHEKVQKILPAKPENTDKYIVEFGERLEEVV